MPKQAKSAQSPGFTLVELLIVIVVIAILAAITVVAYNGITARARDSVRKQDLAKLSKATKLYAVDHGDDFVEAGCGNGTGSGWLTSDYDGLGPNVSINTCLTSPTPYLSKALTDPSGFSSCNGLTCFAYMKGSCSLGTYYYAHLETLPQNGTELNGTCYPSWATSYGMNYYVKVN